MRRASTCRATRGCSTGQRNRARSPLPSRRRPRGGRSPTRIRPELAADQSHRHRPRRVPLRPSERRRGQRCPGFPGRGPRSGPGTQRPAGARPGNLGRAGPGPGRRVRPELVRGSLGGTGASRSSTRSSTSPARATARGWVGTHCGSRTRPARPGTRPSPSRGQRGPFTSTPRRSWTGTSSTGTRPH